MATKLRNIENSGFSANSATEGNRLINLDGSANLRKTGLPFFTRLSLYHTLLKLPRWKFLALIFGWYTLLNIAFAGIYYGVGVEHLAGTQVHADTFTQFIEAFFFSSQTLTTVGYGHMAPVGLIANIIASIESFLGIIMFALVTGVFYGRFSRPKAFLIFSRNIVVAPFKGGRGLMIRLASYKNNHLTDVEAQFTMAIHQQENGKNVTRYYPIPLDIAKINSLALSWTIVHRIDEESPLYNMPEEEIKNTNFELIVNIKAFDDHFSNTVQQRTSYLCSQLVYGAKFAQMYERDPEGRFTILAIDKIGDYEKVNISAFEPENATSLATNA
jgi:inward rectifier potassium channel